jgi:hypothetical protein
VSRVHPGRTNARRGTIAAVSLESELEELMERVAATDRDLAQRLADATRYDPDANVDGVSKGVLTTVDLIRIRGRLDGLREAILRLAREVDALQPDSAD